MLVEQPLELAPRDLRRLRHVAERQCVLDMFFHQPDRLDEARIIDLVERADRYARFARMVDMARMDERVGHFLRQCFAFDRAQPVEHHIERRRTARGRHPAAIDDISRLRRIDIGIVFAKGGQRLPVTSGAMAIKHACPCEQEGAGIDRAQQGAIASQSPELIEYWPVHASLLVIGSAYDGHIRPADAVDAGSDRDGNTVRGCDRLAIHRHETPGEDLSGKAIGDPQGLERRK